MVSEQFVSLQTREITNVSVQMHTTCHYHLNIRLWLRLTGNLKQLG